MKDTLEFYKGIYDPLFRKNYALGNRAGPAIQLFEWYRENDPIEIESVVDVGCAWGKALKYWTKHGAEAVGVDVSPVIIRWINSHKMTAHLSSATDLSIFKDNSFDLYMSCDVYEHIRTEDLEASIQEAKRIAKKLILIRINSSPDRRKKLHLTIWQGEVWQKFFEDNGLEVLDLGHSRDRTTHCGEKWNRGTFLLRAL